MEVNIQIIIAFIVGLVLLILIVPQVFGSKNDNFTVDNDESSMLYTTYRSDPKERESLIFDGVTGSVFSGSQFSDKTGIVAPPWIAPAWGLDTAVGPSASGEMREADYENDSRLLYNKCSLSCCGSQYPTSFGGEIDPFTCDKNGKNKYLSSNMSCNNNTGGIGCVCMTNKQVQGMKTGWVN
jgi:hypothetical protein